MDLNSVANRLFESVGGPVDSEFITLGDHFSKVSHAVFDYEKLKLIW